MLKKLYFCNIPVFIITWRFSRCLVFAHPHGLQQHAEQDEDDADIEREVDFAALAEDEEGQDDGVAGLQVVGEVDGEGREPLQGLDLQQIHAYGAEQRMTEHEPEVGAFGQHDDGLLTGEDEQIGGNDGRYHDEAARHLIHQHGAASHAYAGFLVADGIEGTDSRRDDADDDAVAIAGIERKDAEHAHHGDKREEYLDPRDAALVDERLEDGSEKADEREADNADRHVGGLDAAVEQHPVNAEQRTAAAELQELFPAYAGQAGEHQQDKAGEQHAIPHDVYLVECDKTPEKAGKTSKQHTQMQLYESSFRFVFHQQSNLICSPI